MNQKIKIVSLVVIAISLLTIAVTAVLYFTRPEEGTSIPGFIENKNSTGPMRDAMSENPETNLMLADTNKTTIEFPEEMYDFGKIPDDKKVTHDFRFINTGKFPLVIHGAKSSCGCTIPSWSKEPILPGKEGIITVVFNPSGKGGKQHKAVHVTANTVPNYTIVEFTADVITKD